VNDNLATYGAKFVVESNFNEAVRQAEALDRYLDRVERGVRWLGSEGVAHINAFAAAVARAAAAQGMLLNASGGFLYGPHAGVQTGVLPSGVGVIAPSSSRQPLYLPFFAPVYRPPMPQPFAAYAPPTISPYGVVDPLGGFRTLSGPNLISPVISGTGTVGRVPMAGAPVTGGPSAIGSPPGGTPINPNTPAMGGPTPEIIPHPTMFGRGAYVYTVPFTPVPSAWQRFQGSVNWLQSNVTGPAATATSGIGSVARFFSPLNLMRLASGIYIGQQVSNLARYVGAQTIGQARFLEERLELLENALIGPQMGIDRDLASTLADRLTSSSYFAGMPVTAAEMGLSRAELAEQFRQLAPIIRITARTQDEFQAGLQTGALARALLVARDPVQGTQGAIVALSELYSGGPDRFRSLSLRFELPRNRLREIEQEMGGAGVADPGQVVIQMLREMGFGPEYLVRRAGTFSGQVERFGALFSNFRIDLYERSLERVRDNLTNLNNVFEAFLDSDAGDRVVAFFNDLFGRLTGFITDEPTNLLIGMMRSEGAMDPARLSRSISEYMQARGGQWVDVSGRLVDAATAFREAADLITSRRLEQVLSLPGYNAGSALGFQTALGTVGGVLGMGILDRILTGGMFARASQMVATSGIRAAAAAAGTAALTGLGTMLPIAGIAGLVGTGLTIRQTMAGVNDYAQFAAAYPDIAARYGIPDVPTSRIIAERIGVNIHRLFDALTGGGWLRDPSPNLDNTIYQQQLTAMREGSIEALLMQQAAMLSLGETDPNVIRSHLAGTLYDFIAANPDSEIARLYGQRGAGYIGGLVENAVSGISDRDQVGRVLAGTVLEASAARGLSVVLGGQTFPGDPATMLNAEGQAALWSWVLEQVSGDSKQALILLTEILEQVAQTAVNTSALNPEARFTFMRPSGQGDLFTGFITDPDMRLVRRSGRRLPGATSQGGAVTTASYSVAIGAAGGGTQHATMPYVTRGSYDAFFSGTITDFYGSNRTYGKHGGLDYVLGADQRGVLTAPYSGRVEYLSTPEDYARYPMLDAYDPVATFGNTAVLIDPLGGIHTFSHLSDETLSRFGSLTEVRAGQQFAIQGATGMATGPHIHQEMWMPDGRGGYIPIDPLFAESYFTKVLPNVERSLRSGTDSINISFGDLVINVSNASNTEEVIAQATAAFEAELRQHLRDEAVNIYDRAVETKTRQGLLR